MVKKSMTSIQFALRGLALASVSLALSAHGAQVLTPVKVGTVPELTATSLPAGTTLSFDVNYSVTGTQTGSEAGIGLKVQYDSANFDVVSVTPVGPQPTGNYTGVTNLLTKCLIASPSDQLVTGTTREVVFGWLDTSIRTTPAAGAVGWPGLDEPAVAGATNGCLNPGSIASTSLPGVAPPTTLFRIGLKSKPAFTSGTTNVVLTTAGNISYANTGNADTNKTIVVTAAAAPSCNLDVDGSGTVVALRDGLLILRHLLSFTGAALTSGMTSPTPDATLVANNINAILGSLDINGNIPALAPNALVDGLLLLRMMLTFNGPALTSGMTLNATNSIRFTSPDLINYVNATCGTSFAPGL